MKVLPYMYLRKERYLPTRACEKKGASSHVPAEKKVPIEEAPMKMKVRTCRSSRV
jgi:hypothetical protein